VWNPSTNTCEFCAVGCLNTTLNLAEFSSYKCNVCFQTGSFCEECCPYAKAFSSDPCASAWLAKANATSQSMVKTIGINCAALSIILSQETTCLTTCSNQVTDPDESDVDCGGACTKCANALHCVNNNDCASNICSSKVCAAAPKSSVSQINQLAVALAIIGGLVMGVSVFLTWWWWVPKQSDGVEYRQGVELESQHPIRQQADKAGEGEPTSRTEGGETIEQQNLSTSRQADHPGVNIEPDDDVYVS